MGARGRRDTLRREVFPLLAALVALLLLALPARADLLDEVVARGTLRWGGDQEGGGPYVYPRDDDPSQVQGSDVDLARALAAWLGVEAEFVQGQWDRMPDLLQAGKVDLILSGYELTPARAEVMDATLPYYAYGLQLLVRRDGLAGWDALTATPGRRVGVLTGSAAEVAIRARCPGCAVATYEGTTDAMREVETGKLDATLQDTPIVGFYGPRFPDLVAVGPPVEPGHYVGYVPKGEARLLHRLNEGLVVLARSGELRAIDERYGIWNDEQLGIDAIVAQARFYGLGAAAAADVSGRAPVDPATVGVSVRKRGWEVVTTYGPILLQSAGITVILSVLSFPLAVGLGLLVALGRLYGPRWLRAPLAAWVEFLRGTPLLLQLYFVFFLLPEVGVVVPAFWTAVIGLAVNYSAYESEIYRAGLQAVPAGQLEAALSLGMSRSLALRRVVVPQAFRTVLPPVVNDFIALFKDTSVCSVVTVVELTKRFSVLSLSTQATIELMAMTAVLYLAMSWPLSRAARWIEARTGPGVTA